MSVHTKPWYKKWWGIFIAIIIWPYFLIWFLWAKSKRKLPFKIIFTAIPAAFVFFVTWAFLLATGTIGQTTASNNTDTSSTPTLAQLNSQATDILTTATNKTAQLMLDGKNAATAHNPLGTNADGPFSKWEKTVQSKTDSNTDDAYNNAVALYDDAGQPVPDALNTWKKDNYSVYQDIGYWQFGEGTLLVTLEGGGGSNVSSEQASADSDYGQFQTALAKAQADVSKLSGQPFKMTAQTGNAPQATAPQPTTSLASLNIAAVSTLTPALTDLSQQMATGQADAKQVGASDYGSSFNTWSQNEKGSQNATNNENITKAYNSADNAYYNAHQTVPAALDSWNTDAGSVVSDITKWADAQETVFGDKVSGDSSSLTTDQQTADSDYQLFQSDLAKAQADIKQL